MDPVIILKSAQLGLSFAESRLLRAKLSTIEGKLDRLKQQGDQAITRELLGAFEAISDSTQSRNSETVRSRLWFAEESLLRNTNLNPGLTTSGHSNSFLMMIAHIGLAYVSSLREDEAIAASHLLRAFAADPRNARTEFLEDLYLEIFEPKLGDVFRDHEENISALEAEIPLLADKVQKDILTGAALIAPAASLAAAGTYAVAGLFLSDREKDIVKKVLVTEPAKSASARVVEAICEPKLAELNSSHEDRIDQRCREMAITLLQKVRGDDT